MSYNKYKEIKNWARVAVSLIYWAASMIFFVVGFSFSNPIVIFGKDVSVPLAVALSIANTIIQISGNGDEDKDLIDNVIWFASYILGISTNYIGLTMLLNMNDPNLERVIAGSLGTMIEVLPERMLVKFLKEVKFKVKLQPKNAKPGKFHRPPQSKPAGFGVQLDEEMMAKIRGNRPTEKLNNRVAPMYHNLRTEEE